MTTQPITPSFRLPSPARNRTAPLRQHSKAINPADVLYAHDGTVVTFRMLYIDGMRYVVSDLRGVTKTKSAAAGTALSAFAVAALGLVAAVAFTVSGDRTAWVPGLLLAAIAVSVALAMGRKQSTQYSLHAHYRGADILLFTTGDPRRFGQVARAVQRAIESVPRRPAPHAS